MTPEQRAKQEADAAAWEAARVLRLRALARLETIFEKPRKDPRFPILRMKLTIDNDGILVSGFYRKTDRKMSFVMPLDVCVKEEIVGVIEKFNELALATQGRKQGERPGSETPNGGGHAREEDRGAGKRQEGDAGAGPHADPNAG